MSYVQVTAPSPLSRIGHAVKEFRHRIAQYRVYRSTLEELELLSERDLADLGLHSSMLRSVAYKAAYEA